MLKKIFIKLGQLDRRLIFVLIGLSVLIPLIKPDWINIPIKTTANSEIVFKELNNLKKGDKVITAGGIHGKIIGIQDKTVFLECDDIKKIKIEKSMIYWLSSEK